VATPLGQVDDTEDFPAGTIEASLFGPGDVDWYTFHDADMTLGNFHPKIELTSPAGVDYDLCMYFLCDDGSMPTIDACTGSVSALSDTGLAGCCATGPGDPTVGLSVDCPGFDDSGTIFAEVVPFIGDASCESYTLAWGDD
jgi:hypothetical protein